MRKVGDKELFMVMRRRTRTVTVTKNSVKFAELDRKDYYTSDFVINNILWYNRYKISIITLYSHIVKRNYMGIWECWRNYQ